MKMSIRRPRVLEVVLTLIVLCLGSTPAAQAEKFSVTTGDFIINCTSTGQICDPPETLTIGDPTKKMKVRKFVYDAPAAHCSSGRILIELDGQQVARMRFVAQREQARKRKRLRLAPGLHTLAFRFEGRVGGCNVGSVSSWGGQITVRGRR
jgi:hypothetical protein